ncbi:MAG TPA: ATP-binding protein [Actinomycetes bacterium]|nr:ATP-binding protein [Actinomycetes bacterium]
MSDNDVRALVAELGAIVWEAEGWGGAFTFVSQGAQRLLGYPLDRWNEPDFWINRIHPNDRAAARARARAAIADQRSYESEYRVTAADGRELWLLEIAKAATLGGVAPRVRGLLIDVTERRRSEEWLEQAWAREHEVAEQLRVLNDLKDSFLAAVSHELRSPLSTILGIALTLERSGARLAGTEADDLLARLTFNARKLDQLLTDLLDLDRLQRGFLAADRVSTDLSQLVQRVVQESGLAPERPVEVTTEPVTAAVDPPKLERILVNLLANAARHTPPGTPVWVRLRRGPGAEVLLIVEDAGPGIPPELRTRVFEPFQQAQPDERRTAGVGIGLSLVARFSELHGGRAWVEERPGGGASFRVQLPDADQPEATLAHQPGPAA